MTVKKILFVMVLLVALTYAGLPNFDLLRTMSASAADNTPDTSWLAEVMDQYHQVFSVYIDASAGGNNFNHRGYMGSSMGLARGKEDHTMNPHSGLSCIQVTVDAAYNQWAGFYYMNGILEGDDRQPKANWGDTPDAGLDLTGATKLTFWAKGETGTERVEFFALGVGRNPDTGIPMKPYPDSSPKIGTSLTTLSTNWTEYTLDLSGLDLSYVLGGFGWAAPTRTSSPIVFYLDDIYYDLPRLDAPRLLTSYKTINSEFAADTILRNMAYTYDNAMAILSFLAVGENDRAKLIADALVYAQNHDRYFTDGRIRNAYQSGELILPPGWTPHCKVGTVRMPGWWDSDAENWFEDQFAVGTATGNMAWTMLALLAYYDVNGRIQYLEAAERMGNWVETCMRDERGDGGYMGGYTWWEPNQVRLEYKSTEHNLDLYAAFTRLYNITGDSKWSAMAQHAYDFVMSLWNDTEGHWYVGTTEDGMTINLHRALDCQPWTLLALQDLPSSYYVALDFAEMHNQVPGTWGFDFDDDKDGIWYEGTGQMATAYMLTGQESKAGNVLNEIVGGRAPSGGMYATNVVTMTTGFDNPDGSEWVYYRREHVGATSWAVMAETRSNAFWLGTPSGIIPLPLCEFAADFGRTNCSSDCKGDFDRDDDIDGSDLAVFAADFGRTDYQTTQ
ncbi:MAG: hypothetical protein C4B58_03270 [Deltaproteobacteria bacterium]|nr:MAG: hypothetical protein C4B58_03270 [Deltaproteobacteria bacterium]